jgi:hypothetical protein
MSDNEDKGSVQRPNHGIYLPTYLKDHVRKEQIMPLNGYPDVFGDHRMP